jgi:soluble lytic murein transglycosylase-like protein
MPQAVPQPFQRIQASPADFGGQIGEAIAQGGARVANATDRLAGRAVEMKREDDALKVEQAFAGWSDRERMFLHDPERGIYTRRGSNAVTAYDESSKWWDESAKATIEGLENPNQQRLMQSMLARRRDAALDGVARHAARERQTAMGETWTARLRGIEQDAAASFNDEGKINALLQEADGGTVFWGRRQGLSEDGIALSRRAARSSIRASVVQRMAETDPIAAKDYLDKHREEIDGTTQAQLDRSLRAGVTQRTALNAVNEVMPRPGEPIAPGNDFDSLANAVEREESRGRPGAVSRVGARGVMQLMPGTARMMHDRLFPGQPYNEARLTSAKPEDVAYNRTLGRAYLNDMLVRYGGNRTLALAAYNAGPSRVDTWLGSLGDPRQGAISDGEWAARIPFAETRNYVGKVLGGETGREERVQGSLMQRREELRRNLAGQPPEVLERAEALLANEFSQRRAAEDDLRNTVLREVRESVYRDRNFNTLTPDQLAVLDENPIEKDRLERYVAQRGQVQTDQGTYARLSMMEPDEFDSVDLMDPQFRTNLSETDWKRFVDQQRALRNSTDRSAASAERAGQRNRTQVVATALREAGIDPTPADTNRTASARVASFNRAFDDRLAAWQAENRGKRPTGQDLQRIADELLIQGKVQGSGWLIDDSRRAFELRDQTERDRFRLNDLSDPVQRARVSRVTGMPPEQVESAARSLTANRIDVTVENLARVWRLAQEERERAAR